MDWASALGGFALGLLSTWLTIRVQRSWKKKDDDTYNRKIVEGLITEIEEGIRRSKYMIELHGKNQASFSRIYTALWQSTNQRLAATLSNPEILKLLHRIYYRFDLINFNCKMNRPGSGGAFAKTYLSELEKNLLTLKTLIGISGDASRETPVQTTEVPDTIDNAQPDVPPDRQETAPASR